jgi:glycosyltransferase involved in cell wall biosynthesis
MKLLIYADYPFFDQHLAGGLQTTVRTLVASFLERGLQITVICPECDPRRVMRARGLEVLPVLRELQPNRLYPPDFTENAKQIQKAVEGKDVIWSLAAFPVRVPQPIVLNVMSLCYLDDLEALFGLNWDHLVVPSNYARNIVNTWLAERSWSGASPGGSCIPAPVPPIFYPRHLTTRLRKRLGLNNACRCLLFPHRPEAAKGHELALRVLKTVRQRDQRFHLLIPKQPLGKQVDIPAEVGFIQQVTREARRLGVESHVTFHDWIDFSDLPEYYSLGNCCLFLSRLPETFGAALTQSIACGTYVISSGAGALSETVPPGHGHYLIPDLDPRAISDAVLSGCPRDEVRKGQAFIAERYSLEKVVDAYMECLGSTKKLTGSTRMRSECSDARLYPWFRLLPNGDLIDDFGYRKVPLRDAERAAIQKAGQDGGLLGPGVSRRVIASLSRKRLLA